MVYNISAPRIPAAAISNPDADLLERALRLDPGCELELKITARDLPQTRSANVIAEIPGTDRAGEIVLLGAHLDSWDPGVGAIDDGAGVAIVVAAAHLLRDIEPRPRRTVRVVLFANEEFGLSGSNTYAQREGDALARHAIAMEADLGSGPVWQLSSQVSAASLPFVAEVARALAPLGVARGTNDAKGGSDLTVLAAGGVPVIAPQLDATHYFDFHHTANDTLDKVDPQSLNQSVAAFAITAYLAARADGDLGRAPVAPPVKQP
jgi:Zn-dependent M28 family amino/carboxypeptidase